MNNHPIIHCRSVFNYVVYRVRFTVLDKYSRNTILPVGHLSFHVLLGYPWDVTQAPTGVPGNCFTIKGFPYAFYLVCMTTEPSNEIVHEFLSCGGDGCIVTMSEHNIINDNRLLMVNYSILLKVEKMFDCQLIKYG